MTRIAFLLGLVLGIVTLTACDGRRSGRGGVDPVSPMVDAGLPDGGGTDTPVPETCGNDRLDDGEACDGVEFDGNTCAGLGLESGTLSCARDCSAIDTADCTGGEDLCGNGNIDAGETCDGANVGERSCEDEGFDTGTLRCGEGCRELDTSGCVTETPTSIVSFSANVRDATTDEPITFTVRTTGPASLSLEDVRSRTVLGAFSRVSENQYALTTTGADIFGVVGDFVDEDLRSFVATLEGSAESDPVAITFRCSEGGTCDGECTDFSTDFDCGGCGVSCGDGSCGFVDFMPMCMAGGIEMSIRINSTGLLEAYYSGSWQGVCDDSFGISDATVACRELGMGYSSYTTSRSGPGSSFALDDLTCTGSETRLRDCGHSGWGVENCGSTEWVGLVCTP